MSKSPETLRIGVIGSAGRKEDADRFTKDVYVDAFGSLCTLVGDMVKANPLGKIELVSGGSAFADHMAVQFFLIQFFPCALTIYAPTEFANCEFYDNGQRNNDGRIINYYHEQFSKRLNLNSRAEIAAAVAQGAKLIPGGGMWGRNAKIAEASDVLLAFTFGNGSEAKPGGGTEHTIQLFLRKNSNDLFYHVDLHNPKVLH